MAHLVEQVRTARALPSPEMARAIRKAAHTSQVRLAEELGVHRMTVARWEAGTRRPRGALRAAYASLLAELAQVSN